MNYVTWSVRGINEHTQGVLNNPWRGRGGSSKRAVYFTLCFISYCARGFVVHASVRVIAERTGLSIMSVSRALNSLTEEQYIKCTLRTTENHRVSLRAYEYRLLNLINSMVNMGNYGPLESECNDNEQFNDTNFAFFDYLDWQMHDVFRWHGLGKTCLEVYYFLNQRPGANIAEIFRGTGRCRNSIKRALDRMMYEIEDIRDHQIYPLVSKDGRRYYAIQQDLTSLADFLGVLGMGREKRDQYHHDREMHRRWAQRQIERGNENVDTNFGMITSLTSY